MNPSVFSVIAWVISFTVPSDFGVDSWISPPLTVRGIESAPCVGSSGWGGGMYNARPLGIAFFDLARTLLSINSGTSWVIRELRAGRLTPWQVTRAMYYLALYRLGWAQMEDALVIAVSTLKG